MIKNEDNCVEMFIDGVSYIGGNAHQGILYKKVYTMLHCTPIKSTIYKEKPPLTN